MKSIIVSDLESFKNPTGYNFIFKLELKVF